MSKHSLKPLPRFRSEREERAFWRTHDSADYLDLSRARPAIFPNLKPTSRAISIRLPGSLLAELKALAHRRGVPYQALMKIFLAERVKKEFAT